jgi:hypothetical protein
VGLVMSQDVPWYALSPSIFTFIFWFILAVWGAKQLLKKAKYRRFKSLIALTDATFILGFIVLITDFMWVVVCGLRFGLFFQDSILQLLICALRDIFGLLFCYTMIFEHFKTKVIKLDHSTIMLCLTNLVFLVIWFSFAPNPAFTDWTYAIKYEYPFRIILTSFLISHGIGKSIVVLMYYSLFKGVNKSV